MRTPFIILLVAAFLGTGVLALAAPKKAEKGKKGKDAEEAPEKDPKEVQRQKNLEKQAKVSIGLFKKEYKSKKVGKRVQAVFDLARIHHDMVIDELAKKPLYERSADVRDATAQLFADFTFNVPKAGGVLKVALGKNEDFPEVQRSIVRSIGKLKYMDALEELKAAASRLNEQKYKWVTVEVVRTFGVLNDKRALPFLLWMSEYGGRALKWSTGEVKVDKTRSGDADQREAEAKWKAKYGHVKPKKPPAPLIREYMQELQKAVKKMTGQEFKDATSFRKWLIAHAEELGLDPKALTKD
ncbi:MAG: hypothetical protein ABFS86_09355 [Planctomycetota bacterium]